MPTESDVAYLDSSALVKLAIEEAETAELRLALRRWPRRASSRISRVEVVRAVRRQDPSAEGLAHEALGLVSLLRIGDRLLASAALLEPRLIRSLDAIHVASALTLGSALAAFVSYDARQLQAAQTLGLPVASPR